MAILKLSMGTDRKSLLALRGIGPECEAESVRFHGRRVTKVGPGVKSRAFSDCGGGPCKFSITDPQQVLPLASERSATQFSQEGPRIRRAATETSPMSNDSRIGSPTIISFGCQGQNIVFLRFRRPEFLKFFQLRRVLLGEIVGLRKILLGIIEFPLMLLPQMNP